MYNWFLANYEDVINSLIALFVAGMMIDTAMKLRRVGVRGGLPWSVLIIPIFFNTWFCHFYFVNGYPMAGWSEVLCLAAYFWATWEYWKAKD